MTRKPTYAELEERIRLLEEENQRLQAKDGGSLSQYRNILSSTPDGVALLDKSYRYLFVNRAYERFSGLSRDRFIGRTVADYLGEERFRESVKPNFDRCLEGEVIHYQQWFSYPAAGSRYVEVTYFPYRDGDSAIAGVVAHTRDSTSQKLAEEALARSYQGLELRARIARTFLTAPRERLFQDVLDLLLTEFESIYGYLGYIDENGDLVCPTMTEDVWEECRIPDKGAVFPRDCWGGIWGESLERRIALRRNGALDPPPGDIPVNCALVVPLMVNHSLFGQIALANKAGGYTGEDLRQLEILAEFLAPVLQIYLEKEKASRELEAHAEKLEEKNIALKVLLENREEEMEKLVHTIRRNFQRLVFPYYEKIKTCRRLEDLQTLIRIVETHTEESLSPIARSASTVYEGLTPREIQVADLIKAGRSSKEIAEVLNLSTRAVFFHRGNIRKKLHIENKKANLRTHLLSPARPPG